MQLVLMNKSVWCREIKCSEPDFNLFDVLIFRDQVTWCDCNDEVAEKLISEIFTPESELTSDDSDSGHRCYSERNSELRVKCQEHSGDRLFEMLMKHRRGDNIFEALRNRFFGKVKISATLEKSAKAQASTGEMTITSDYKCRGIIDIDLLGDEFCYDDDRVRMTIVAHISLSDDDILASTQFAFSKKVLDDALFTDVTISTKDGTELKAHKSFLSACSPVLGAAFASGFEESKSGKLDMSDFSEKGAQAFLRYVYYRDLDEAKDDMKLAFELLYAAHKYNVIHLEAWGVGRFLDLEDEDFSVEMAFVIYTFVKNIDDAAALEYIFRSF